MTLSRPLLKYHGGKWRLAPWIIEHFPPHSMYVEPFGGGASVLLRKMPSKQEVYNDLDEEIVNFFRILRQPQQAMRLIEMLALTPHSRQEYELSCEPLASDECPVEKARRTVVRSFMGYGSAALTGQYKTGFRNRHKIGDANLALNWSRLPEQIPLAMDRLRLVTLECLPAVELIPKYDHQKTLFYVDPPYVHETRNTNGNAYRHEMTDEQHAELARQLHAVKGMVIISGYDCPLYRELYAGWEMSTRVTIGEKAAHRTECLWRSPQASRKADGKSLLELEAV